MAIRSGAPPALTVVEVIDAAGFAGLTKRLSKENRHLYRLRDPAAAASFAGPLCRHVLRATGDLQVSWVEERLGTQVEILEPGVAAHCFATFRSGQMSLSVPGAREPAMSGPSQGLIHHGQGGTAALTRNGTARANLWVSSARIEGALSACLGETVREPVVFRPAVDWTSPGGAAVQRLLAHAIAEFEREDGLATQRLALAGFTDLFVHTVLSNLPHNYSERLARVTADTAPRHLRRAEAFMRAEAGRPLRLAEIAAVAGCSVRSLQNAFRSFRDTTPHEALQGIRLELAKADLQQGGDPMATVARRYGFSNAGRFATLYARRFGVRPRAPR